jgi:CRISPR-associated protein Cas5t
MFDTLYIDCPCTSFPRSFARDYKETYDYPPPSTIYGFLLSLVGESDLMAHVGVKLAIGIIGDSKTHMGTYPASKFSKPNFQELITDVKVVLKLDSSEESATLKLGERVAIALSSPEQITRFGGLSLGESWALVNGIRLYREADGQINWLVKDCRGLISLPVWINRQNSRGTFQRFSLGKFNSDCWVEIQASRD